MVKGKGAGAPVAHSVIENTRLRHEVSVLRREFAKSQDETAIERVKCASEAKEHQVFIVMLNAELARGAGRRERSQA